MSRIQYFTEPPLVYTLPHIAQHSTWLHKIATTQAYFIKQLQYVFCTDEHLWEINCKFLDHDTLTDIITFDNTAPLKNYNTETSNNINFPSLSELAGIESETQISNSIDGEIYISLERVQENAISFKTNFIDELHRVMAHGLLHLMDYADKTDEEIKKMRSLEDKCLQLTERPIWVLGNENNFEIKSK